MFLKITADRNELIRVASAIEDLAEQENWPIALAPRVTLAVEELALNIIDYGDLPDADSDTDHSGTSGGIDISIASEPEKLTIEVVSGGIRFDPFNDAPAPDLEASLDERSIGGLGIHLVRTMMDETYYQWKNHKNHMTLVVHRTE